MACEVGPANPDIAGLGIMISFAFQAGLSLILSLWSLVLWKSAITSLDQIGTLVLGNAPGELAAVRAGNKSQRDAQRAIWTSVISTIDKYLPGSRLKRFPERVLAALDQLQAEEDAAPDPAALTVGRRLWKGGQRAAIKKKCIDDILAAIGDVQIMNAMGLLIAALIQHKTMSLYHQRIVYDMVSFTGISACASFVNISAYPDNRKRTRTFALVVYICTFVSFCVVFSQGLQGWDQDKPGRCYNTRLVVYPRHAHPVSDMVYLALTCFYSGCALFSCYGNGLVFPVVARLLQRAFQSKFARSICQAGRALRPKWYFQPLVGIYPNALRADPISRGFRMMGAYFALMFHPTPEYRVWVLLPLALVQYPLHLYMTIAMRKSNERFLKGDSENSWGFGQIVALVLCAATCIECVRGFSEYRKVVRVGPVQVHITQQPGQSV